MEVVLGARNELIQREKDRESVSVDTRGELKRGDWLSGHTLVLSSGICTLAAPTSVWNWNEIHWFNRTSALKDLKKWIPFLFPLC